MILKAFILLINEVKDKTKKSPQIWRLQSFIVV